MGSASKLLKNTTVLLISNFATKTLSALFIIYLARYLEDYGFGQYNFALSFAAVFIIFSDLGLDALTIKSVARDVGAAGEYLESVGMLRFCLSILMVATSLAAGMLMGLDSYLLLVILVAGIAYMFDKMSGLFYAIFRASERMELEAGIQISWKLIQLSLGFGAIYFGFPLLGIMMLLMLSSVFKALMGFSVLLGIGVRPSGNGPSRATVIRGAMPFAAYEIGNALYMNMAIIMLFLLRSPQETGWFSAGLRIIMFMLLVPSAFDAAIYPLFSKLYKASAWDMRFAYGKSIKFSLATAIPVCIALAILSEDVAGIFGTGFGNTANVLFVMSVLLPLYSLNLLMKTALWSGDAQNQIAVNIWISVGVICVASYILIIHHSYIGAALALVISESVFLALNGGVSRRRQLPMGRYLGKPVLAGICMAAAAASLVALAGQRMSHFQVATLAFLVYMLALLLMGFLTRSDISLFRNALSRGKI